MTERRPKAPTGAHGGGTTRSPCALVLLMDEGVAVFAGDRIAQFANGEETIMERIRTVDLGGHAGERVRVAGWLHAVRRLGGVSFAVVRDGWGMVQAVTESEDDLAPLM